MPFFGFSEPIAAAKKKYGETDWTLWDRFELAGNPTLQELIDFFQNKHGLEVGMVSQGVSMLWSPFVNRKKVRFFFVVGIFTFIRHVCGREIDRWLFYFID